MRESDVHRKKQERPHSNRRKTLLIILKRKSYQKERKFKFVYRPHTLVTGSRLKRTTVLDFLVPNNHFTI